MSPEKTLAEETVVNDVLPEESVTNKVLSESVAEETLEKPIAKEILTEKSVVKKDVLNVSSASSTIKVDKGLKKECEILFDEIGLSLDVAVTLFLKEALRKKRLQLDLLL